MSNIQRTNSIGVDSPLTSEWLEQIKADLSLPSDAIQQFTDLWARISAPRGISDRQKIIDANAAAGIDTLLLTPADYTVSTLAEYNSAVTAATAALVGTDDTVTKVIRWAPNTHAALTSLPSAVPPKVSVISGGNVHLTVAFTPSAQNNDAAVFRLHTDAENSVGNQRIQGLNIDGVSYLGAAAVSVRGRTNTEVVDCTIAEFGFAGITFNGRAVDGVNGAATTKATGNGVLNCVVLNCGSWQGPSNAGYASGGIQYGSQSGFRLIDTIAICKDKPAASVSPGYPVKYYLDGHNVGTLVLNCDLQKSSEDGTPQGFTFSFECWNESGLRVFNSSLEGFPDLNGLTPGAGFSYGAIFAGNQMGFPVLPTPKTPAVNPCGIELECASGTGGVPCSGIYVIGNAFRNCVQAVMAHQKAGTTGRFTNIIVRHNTMWNCRVFEWTAAANEGGTDRVDVEYNTLRCDPSYYLHSYVKLPEWGVNSNWTIRRNVGEDARVASVFQAATAAGSTTNVKITDNIFKTGVNAGSQAISIATAITTGYVAERNRDISPVWKAAGSLEHMRQGVYGASPAAGSAVALFAV